MSYRDQTDPVPDTQGLIHQLNAKFFDLLDLLGYLLKLSHISHWMSIEERKFMPVFKCGRTLTPISQG